MRVIACMILCFIFLTACAPHRTAVSPSPQMHALCKINCQQRLNSCNQLCHDSCQQCEAFARQTTAKSYQQYKNEQYVSCGIIARELKSYRDPLQCRKTTCDCPADYRVCIQSCAGLIHKRLQVAPTCC